MQSFIVKLAQRIHIQSHPNKDSQVKGIEFFHKTFPYFIWLLRDVMQSIPSDCRDIRDYFFKKVNKKRELTEKETYLVRYLKVL